ncbi:MAG TPA: zf-HC2 domain-containing protein [Pyrinomonadaceae bacterium]|nr:zf-HC2 domain-containing protein [Pyrinomonadaceae bacterium]
MICHKSLEMIHLYVDGELDELEAAQVQRHIYTCEDCKLRYRTQVALRSSLQDSSLYYRAPVELKRRIRSSLQQEVETEATWQLAIVKHSRR